MKMFLFIEGKMNLKEINTKPITAEEEYLKNPELKKDDIKKLRQWFEKQSHLPDDITGLFILINFVLT